MIDIRFKTCCLNCGNIEESSDVFKTTFGNYVTIGCEHAEVCKKYLETPDSQRLVPERREN